MAFTPRTGRRCGAMSFDAGNTYGATPSTADITLDAAAARTGTSGLKCNIQSSVSSTLVLPATILNAQAFRFERFYVSFSNFPSSTRGFAGQAAATLSRVHLRITSAGKVELRYTSTTLGTSLTTLSTGQFYMIEVGINSSGQLAKLRIDGNTEVDWVATGGTTAVPETWMFGCPDTTSGAFLYYIDDYVWDARDFPGPGRVKLVKVLDVVTDNAGFVLTGTTKPAALDPNPSGSGFDDTTFLTVSSSGISIVLGLDSIPSDSVAVMSVTPWFRSQRTGGSSSSFQVRTGWRGNGTPESVTSGATQMNSVSGFTVQSSADSAWSTIFGGFVPTEYKNELTYGMQSSSANGQAFSALWFEVDYSDTAGDIPFERVMQLATFEESVTGEFQPTNRSTTGTASQVQTWSQFGSSSLEIVHASGGQSRLTFQLDDNKSTYAAIKMVKESVWIYCTARPSSGNVGVLSVTGFTLFMTSTGTLIADVNGTQSSAAGSVPLNTATHIAVELTFGTSGANNSHFKVYVNDVLVIDFTTSSTVVSVDSSTFFRLGAAANVTGGATIRYDGLIIDGSVRHDSRWILAVIVPTGSGSISTAGFTASAGSKWQCVDDLPNNGDTDYVLLATGLGTTSQETYAMQDISASAVRVAQMFIAVMSMKRDAASNGSVRVVLLGTSSSVQATALGSTVVSTSAYTQTAVLVEFLNAFGQYTPAIANSLEAGEQQGSNTVATRISALSITIAYLPNNDYPRTHRNRVRMH